MDNEKLVELVTAEVLRRLRQAQSENPIQMPDCLHKALAIFTGGSIGLETSLEELKTLQNMGTELIVVLSPAAETIVGENWIREKLGNSVPIVTTKSPYPGQYLRKADIVLVPVLTQNTAAKLAHTLADTMVCTLIMQALMLGKPVIAAANAADPQDGWRLQKNMGQTPPALREALENNLKKIATYGIELTPVTNLAAAAQKVLIKESCVDLPSIPVKTAKKQVLTAAAVRYAAQSGNKAFRVAQGTIITPLARDVARECNVDIVWD
ncbi:Coenzyme A biosynthesis bifunctional protein CoaBC [Sporomusa silvacetica DSM 10669]|uniref:Coenzyme A biosynthesis bifunctional protein CoaBC n=1 Tax=Sporomusa silvacetica DSM 10669 TaxID=1123289 RepID=A0ABZ3IRZ8_9FIRM|nr:flavoprotein [Sporomusa silvacetica]OZC14478.1 bifunctional phosphopantothenoylcysteine decarboxylase/phosphopantothenate synthase [Sporomusa silvacetica DSM 10669]